MKKSEISGYTFAVIDLLTALVVVLFALAIRPVADPRKAAPGVKPQGSLVISLYWDKAAAADVDLWTMAPGEPEPIGYSHRDGLNCDLLRDDRGEGHDPVSRNMETTVCRVAAAGEYVANAVAYASYDGRFPIHVLLVVQSATGAELLREDGALTRVGDEITLARFGIGAAGALVPGSVNQLPMRLYLAARGG